MRTKELGELLLDEKTLLQKFRVIRLALELTQNVPQIWEGAVDYLLHIRISVTIESSMVSWVPDSLGNVRT